MRTAPAGRGHGGDRDADRDDERHVVVAGPLLLAPGWGGAEISREAVYGKANEGHWFLFSGAIQVGFQGGRKPTLARSLRGCPCFYGTEAIRSFRSIGLISRSEVCPDKTSRRATTTTACIATNHTKRDHNYLMRDYGSNVKK